MGQVSSRDPAGKMVELKNFDVVEKELNLRKFSCSTDAKSPN